MSLVLLSVVVAAIWVNLVGVGLAANRVVRDYALARVAGVLAVCLAGFSLEHLVGFGPRLVLLPLSTAAAAALIWRHRGLLRENWPVEAAFGVGFLYCLAWRFAFPDIDPVGERMPNLAMIEGYMRGTRLPAPDLWMYPYRANFYYSFQHYGAALLGRLLGLGPGMTYQLAFCTLVGLIALLVASCISRLCAWPAGRVVSALSLALGGSGAVVAALLFLTRSYVFDSVNFLGEAMEDARFTPLGKAVASWMRNPGVLDRDLPMWPLSYVVARGDYHPPLSGFLLLAFAATLIAAQETRVVDAGRKACDALLGASLPIALISDTWIFPLQSLLVIGWFLYRGLRGDWRGLLLGLAGAAAAGALEYPYLVEFAQQAVGQYAAIRWTEPSDRTPLLGWLLIFWPVVGILGLALLNRERRPFSRFLIALWCAELAATELLYNHDYFGGVWIRFNSTLKWWSWVYAGIVLTLGAANLGSKSRVCRVGTLLLLLPSLIFGAELAREFWNLPKPTAGRLAGSGWIEHDPVVRDMVVVLASRPDGVAIESGLGMDNTESPAVSLFSGKQSLLGWPWREIFWRGPFVEVRERLAQIDAFYNGRMADPVPWLLYNHVTFILWLPRDNAEANARFPPLAEKLKGHYFWHQMYGADATFVVGFWERFETPPAP